MECSFKIQCGVVIRIADFTTFREISKTVRCCWGKKHQWTQKVSIRRSVVTSSIVNEAELSNLI